uniref:Uncharacterized protein n=1 Tax=Candidatus Kentrum sp. FM TaxID=2126340 RepID=A0A450W2M1_9GAMM|nr:MAG: hypothetical protein BECKFM1743A_GA0114220_101584 [Candidatus Kentron sp. FM]VFJ58591.1 MAG: hypothetical protein BECKFM1743C_GA0114222_102292 [Candidatus Kentron sp. FM]VFK11146.1 MAG: hypothetical protein BECKFM1743B_GA0114221_101694 [Candidatus Kentron sp. FM]
MSRDVVVLLKSSEGRKLVREKCASMGLELGVLELLVEAEVGQLGKLRKRGLWEEFDEVFDTIEKEDAG